MMNRAGPLTTLRCSQRCVPTMGQVPRSRNPARLRAKGRRSCCRQTRPLVAGVVLQLPALSRPGSESQQTLQAGWALAVRALEPDPRVQEAFAVAEQADEPDHSGKTGFGLAVRAVETEPVERDRQTLDVPAARQRPPVQQHGTLLVREHPMAQAAADKDLLALQRQRLALEAALQGARRSGGDRYLEEALQARLRAVNKKSVQLGDPTRLHLRAVAMQRDEQVKTARAESKAQEARARELKLLVELRKAEADMAKAKSKEAAAAAKKEVVQAQQDKAAEARRRAQQEEQARRLRLEFAASLVADLHEYIRHEKSGHERFQRCQRLALHGARTRAGLQKLDVPRFWTPTIVGLKQLMPEGHTVRLRAKSEVLYASPEFCWALFGKGSIGKEGKWTA